MTTTHQTPETPTSTSEAFLRALNKAADEITELSGLHDLVVDVTNLMVNAVAHYLEHPDHTLVDVVKENYDDEPDTVLRLIKDA